LLIYKCTFIFYQFIIKSKFKFYLSMLKEPSKEIVALNRGSSEQWLKCTALGRKVMDNLKILAFAQREYV